MTHIERITTLSGIPFEQHLERYKFATAYCRSQSVLDIATGSGYGSHLLSASAARVVGVDVSADGLRIAKGRFSAPNLHFVLASGTQLPLTSGSVEVVVSFETIEHIEDYRGFLAELARVAKAGATIVLSTPNKAVSDRVNSSPNPFHVKEFTTTEFRAVLEEFWRPEDISLFVQHPYYPSVGLRAKINPLLRRTVALLCALDRWNLRTKFLPRAISQANFKYVQELSADARVYPLEELSQPTLFQLAVITARLPRAASAGSSR